MKARDRQNLNMTSKDIFIAFRNSSARNPVRDYACATGRIGLIAIHSVPTCLSCFDDGKVNGL